MNSVRLITWMLDSLLLFLLVPHSVALPQYETTDSSSSNPTACTSGNVRVRKEWGALSLVERKGYVDAVKCLMKRPSQLPQGLAPGAISRYDDFTATHINLTLKIHGNGVFLAWHRHFLYLFQEELENNCGYRGTAPYWNWPLWAANLSSSPIFDGSSTSLSGDGEYITDAEVPTFENATFPRGTGGGCVRTGPFANLTLPFRTFAQDAVFKFNGTLPRDSLDYAPHCFRRDLSKCLKLKYGLRPAVIGMLTKRKILYIATHFTTQSEVDYLIYTSPDITDFQNVMNGIGDGAVFGVHSGGHYTAGPDLFDFFASPSDPVFQLHHGMIDLVYTLWQAQDPSTRQYALSGGSTTFNIPASPNVTVDDYVNFGYLDRERRIGDLMDVTKGPYCYRYEF